MTEKSTAAGSSGHHPGELAEALRAATVEVILDKGLGAFSLREVARRAGVSHAAPGYHFGDVRGLLTHRHGSPLRPDPVGRHQATPLGSLT